MKNYARKTGFRFLGLMALLSWPFTAGGVEIDFEVEEGYHSGTSPVGLMTPAGRWHGKADWGEIVPGQGVEGGQSLRLPPTGEFASMSFDPGFPTIPSKMKFSAMVKLEDIEEGSFHVPLRLRVGLDGDAEAVRIHFYAGGKVEFFGEGKIVRALDASGEQFLMRRGAFTKVDLVLDFENACYQLELNGVPQRFDDKDWIPFQSKAFRERVGRFELTNSHLTKGGVHIDRIRWTADE